MKKRFLNYIKKGINTSYALAKVDFILRNEGSYLGLFWYILNPILLFILLYLIFFNRLGQNISIYPLYLLLGIIMFNFFQNATAESTRAIENNKGVIKSIRFPRESIILSITLRNLYSHLFELILFSILLIVFKISLIGVFYYLILLILMCIFIFGISLMLSSLTVYFIDLDNLWMFGSKLLWFATPIFYAIEGQTRLFYLNLLNPMYYFITIARDVLIYSKVPQSWIILGSFLYSFIFLFAGLIIFNKLNGKFAEMV